MADANFKVRLSVEDLLTRELERVFNLIKKKEQDLRIALSLARTTKDPQYKKEKLEQAKALEAELQRLYEYAAILSLAAKRTGALQKRSTKLAKTFRRMATNMVWATLSVLGVVWSLEGFVSRTSQPLLNLANRFKDISGAVEEVAKWLAMAKKEGLGFAEDIDIQEVAQDMVDTGMAMQATFANLQAALLYFFTELFKGEEGKKLLKEIEAAFEDIVQFLLEPETIAAIREFTRGLVQGAKDALPLLRSLRDIFKPIIYNIGKVAGAVAVLLPFLAPLLVLLQSVLAVGQGLIFAFSNLAGVFSSLGGVVAFLAENPIVLLIGAIAALIGWVWQVTEGFRKWENLVKAVGNALKWLGRIARDVLRYLPLGGISALANIVSVPSMIHVDQRVHIDHVHREADISEVSRRLAHDLAYNISR